MLKIGNLKINTKLILAPLSGVSDLPFRTLCRNFGCKFAFTEMLNAASIKYKSKKTQNMLLSNRKDSPLGAQLLGRDIDMLLNAQDVIQKTKVKLLDFNAACPVRKVARRGEGVALMKEPKLLANIIRKLTSNAAIPITVKIRSGWSKDNINAVSIAKQLQDAGASAIFVHARTKEQLYRGKADYNVIAKVKQEINIPVIGSGDVFEPEDVKRMLAQTGCDAVLIARGAMGNPWIFKHSQYFLKTGKSPTKPTIAERIKTIKLHLELMSKLYNEKGAVLRMRLFLPLYLKGIPHARKVRGSLSKLKTKKQLLAMILTLA